MNATRILLIASELPVREEVKRLFKGFNVEIDSAADPVQAVSLLAKAHYQGMIIDERLGKVSGMEFAKRVKGKLKNVRVLLLVPKTRPDIRRQAITSDFIDFAVIFPWQSSDVEKTILDIFPIQPLQPPPDAGDTGRYVLQDDDSGETLDSDVVKMIIKGIDDLPPLPDVVQKILSIVDQQDTGARDLARIITSEPSLTAKILKITNSSFYGLAQKVTTVSRAVVILGFNEVKNLVLGYSIFSNLIKNKGEEKGTGLNFWKHNIACGVGARLLGEKLRYGNTEELFVVGLLHDIGKTILYDYFTERYKEIRTISLDTRRVQVEVEKNELGLTHADIGFWLARHWNLPGIIRDGIRYHHAPSLARQSSNPSTPLLAGIVCFADNLTKLLGIGDGGDPFVGDMKYSSDIETLNMVALNPLCEELRKQVGFFEQSLGIAEEPSQAVWYSPALKKHRFFIFDDTKGISPFEIILGTNQLSYKRFQVNKRIPLDMLSAPADVLLINFKEEGVYEGFIERLHKESIQPPLVIALTKHYQTSASEMGVYYYQKPIRLSDFRELLTRVAS